MKLKNTTDWSDLFLRRMVAWCAKQLELPVRKVRSIDFRNKTYGYSGHCHVATGQIVVSAPKARTYKARELTAADHDRLKRRIEQRQQSEPEWTPPADPVAVVSQVGTMHDTRYCDRGDADALAEKLTAEQRAGRITDLVRITAHELAHRMLYLAGDKSRKSRRYGRVTRGGSEQRTEWFEREVLKAFEANRDGLLADWNKERALRAVQPEPSLQEQRAAKVQAALERWQRKAKLAATKVRQYKQKVRYYEHAIAAKRGPNA